MSYKNKLLMNMFAEGWERPTVSTRILVALMEQDKPINRKELNNIVQGYYVKMTKSLEYFDKLRLIRQFKQGRSIMVEINRGSKIVQALEKLVKECQKEQIIREL